jgi:hypothetical protein
MSELNPNVLGVLDGWAAGGQGELHRRDGPVDVPVQLAQVRDAAVGREIGTGIDHLLDRVDGFVIAPELDLRVTDHAVRDHDLRRDLADALAELESIGELVAGQGERAEPDEGGRVVRVDGERAVEGRLGARIVRWIPGHAHLLEKRGPEAGQGLRAVG